MTDVIREDGPHRLSICVREATGMLRDHIERTGRNIQKALGNG